MSSNATAALPPDPIAVFEHAYYIGNYMSAILYGIYLMLFGMTIRSLLSNRSSEGNKKFIAIYSTIILLLLTIDISVNAVWGELMWINSRSTLPGGPVQFFAENISVWYQAMGSSSVVAIIFMGDAFLIYRCFMLWEYNIKVVIFPCLVYLCAFALAIVELVESFIPNGNFFGGKSVTFGTTYYTMTIAINVILTALICVRLSRLSKMAESTLGAANAKVYTSVTTITVESAALYTVFGIIWLIPYATGSMTAIGFGQVWAKVAAIAPQLILLRLGNGNAWRQETVSQIRSTTAYSGDTSSIEKKSNV